MDHTLNSAAIEAGLRNPAPTFAEAYGNVRALIQAERNLPEGFTDDDVDVAATRTIEALDVLAAVPASSASDAFAKVAAICTIHEAHGIDHLNAALAELGALLAPSPAPSSDAALVSAWEKWKSASLAVEMVGREDADPAVAAHYAERDLAEQAILNSPATSIAGLLVKQRFALECTTPDAWVFRALYDGDDATLIARKAELDLEGRLIVDTIQGLLAAGSDAASAPTPFRLAHDRYLAARAAFTMSGDETDPVWAAASREWDEAANAMDAMAPLSWAEFADAFMVACDQGESGLGGRGLDQLVADVERLRAQSGGPTPTPLSGPWQSAMTDYASAARDDDGEAQGAALWKLHSLPAPDLSALLWKVEHLLATPGGSVEPWASETVALTLSDARRLLGSATQPTTPEHDGIQADPKRVAAEQA